MQFTSLSPESLLLEHSESGRLALSKGELSPTASGEVNPAKACEEEGEVMPKKFPPSCGECCCCCCC